jgi:serine/threonine protein kinase/tetratricopeptide (TPR) repeat protein
VPADDQVTSLTGVGASAQNEHDRVCGKCGSKLPADAPQGVCPACLLQAGLSSVVDESVAEVAQPLRNEGGRPVDTKRGARPARMLGDFGDYELLEEIGRGGQGVVYRAHQKSLNRTVALKVIGLGPWTTEAHLKRFRREAEAAAKLQHPSIVPIHEVGDQDGRCYFSMNFIEGGQLDEVVRRTPISIRQAAELIAKVALTVQYAHGHGILHRDIKPGNILLDAKGAPHLTDFGLARLVEAESTITRTLEVMGTPSYMAPEQAAGEHTKVSSATDVYGLGAVLYQLLTGHPPFAGGTSYETIRLLRDTEPRQPRLWNPKIDRELSTICLKCLEKDPKRRYSSALALAEDLEHWLRHEPIQAKPSGFFTHSRKWVRRNPSTAVLVTVLVAFAIGSGVMVWNRKSVPLIPKSVAVLPFSNLSKEEQNAYFAHGVQDQILTDLSQIADLKVISRTSVMQYKSGGARNLRKIAEELGVAHVVEGSVQRAANKIRVSAQLIDARTDVHLWAQTYDRDLADVFAIQSEIAKAIADQLQAKLSPSESHVLVSVRTHDTEAYDLFLRGEYEFRQAEKSFAPDAYVRADAFYRQALARDPNFAEAAAALAHSRLLWHWEISLLAPAELEEVKSLIDRALALAPNLPGAHVALGVFFYVAHRQYEMALTEFNRALELQPNNALARAWCALVYRRRGEWERSLADFQRAQELDPRDARVPRNIGQTYLALRLWKDAERAELRALAIDPHDMPAAAYLLSSRLNGTGDVDSARRVFDDFPEAIKSLNLVGRGNAASVGFVDTIISIPAYLDAMQRRFSNAFQALDQEVANDDRAHLQQLAGRVAVHVMAGEREAGAAKSAGEEALPLLEARLRQRPDDTLAMTGLSWVYLALGRNPDALRLSRQAADSLSIERDAMAGPFLQIGVAQIEARGGAPEEAIKRLRRLLSIPAGQVVSIARLKIDPVWDPIRDRPDFQQLLSGPEQVGPNK